ncbi:hypothetical protein [Legionella quateirensis]|uniref:Uncharacterized protein n=1 Tax=Legionella quateirensis TaxID=45072 RepID=A0A378KRK1_9GAMM|nr:hypothetical protein [Legionella quateirensis]KTD52993.1 hypothetical protein Lqua_0826 [Legionella quateirensis]STY17213.1 Uncharacterised protein [Legionella quateirensis]
MEIEIRILCAFLLLSSTLNAAHSASEFLIPRYKKWLNPILKVIHQYDLSLFEFPLSRDRTSLTFYLNFKHSPADLLNQN